jgi:hypothetical protein
VDRAGQAGGYNSRTTNVPESLSDFSRPWSRNTTKTQTARKKNPTQSLAKQHQNGQELTSNSTTKDTWIKKITRGKLHKTLTPVKPV